MYFLSLNRRPFSLVLDQTGSFDKWRKTLWHAMRKKWWKNLLTCHESKNYEKTFRHDTTRVNMTREWSNFAQMRSRHGNDCMVLLIPMNIHCIHYTVYNSLACHSMNIHVYTLYCIQPGISLVSMNTLYASGVSVFIEIQFDWRMPGPGV